MCNRKLQRHELAAMNDTCVNAGVIPLQPNENAWNADERDKSGDELICVGEVGWWSLLWW